MTTIIATPKIMMGDTAVAAGVINSTKIYKHKGKVYGFCGNEIGNALRLMKWVMEGAKGKIALNDSDCPDEEVDVEVLQIDGSRIYLWDKYLQPIQVNMPYFAIGSGRDFALGALAQGATIEQAMEIAAKFDGNTRPPYDIISL